MKAIVIVDREESRRAALKVYLEPEYQVLEFESLRQLCKAASGGEFRAVFLAWMPGEQEKLKTLPKIDWSTDYVVPMLLMPKDFSLEQVKAEMECAETWSKNTIPQALIRFIPRLASREIQRVTAEILARPILDFPEILAASPEILRLMKLAVRAAAGNEAVLITGEPGSGKQTLARWIHLRSSRGQTGAPFEVYRLCPGIDPALAASELCGHAKGAFPWAANSRRGSLEAANTGTLYIPEIRGLPAQAQLQIDRLLADPLGGMERLGGDAVQRVDVRIIAGTRRPLDQPANNDMCEDLLTHLKFRLEIPPLRSRREDMPVLVEHFLQRGGSSQRPDGETMAALQRYPWPNNLDELDQALKDALFRADEGSEIRFEHLPPYIQHAVERLS
jgi:DNA-binding NtrC family response regulator